MIKKRPIRNLSSNKQIPTGLFDVVIDDEHEPKKVYIEQKINKDHTERALWEDVKYQVECAIRDC